MALDGRSCGGFHSIVEEDHPYVFVDATMQAWPDAEFDKAHRHGVTAYCVTAWRPHTDLDGAIRDGMQWHRWARQNPRLGVASSVADIRRAKADGSAVFVIAAQGGDWIADQLHRVEAMHRLGLRMLLLAYNSSNGLAGGMLEDGDGGLTRFGRLVASECNRVGIVLDGTHTARRATLEMIDLSSKPCVFSHSNPSQVVANPRNIDDEQILACARRGGVVCLAPWGPLVLRPNATHWPTISDFIDLVDHVAQLTGSVDHIGIGTDMSLGTYPDHWRDPWGSPEYPNCSEDYGRKVTSDVRSPKRNLDGFNDYAEVVDLIGAFLERGYSDVDVGKILGENVLRVFDDVWRGEG